jgi:putative transposase
MIHVLIGAIGIDGLGEKHILGLIEGATENAAATQALLDNLAERGPDSAVPRLFSLDGAKAPSKAVRATFGRHMPIQRCQVHKARNIAGRCPKKSVASVRTTLRKAWEMDDAAKSARSRISPSAWSGRLPACRAACSKVSMRS